MDHPLPQSAADYALNGPIARIHLHVGDITDPPPQLGIDAIANAANESLRGGGGVDGAIHRAAGPQLLDYCIAHYPDGCPTGLAKHTPAFGLQNKGVQHILHAVGPVWPQEEDGLPMPGVPGNPLPGAAKLGYTHADNLLASCYTQLFALAVKHNIQHLAIPAISTGVYRFPKPRAARIALGHTHGHLLRHDTPHRVTFVCFNNNDADHYRDAINTRGAWMLGRGRV